MKQDKREFSAFSWQAFCFALMNTFVRLSGDLPSVQKSFFRNLVAAAFAGSILIKIKPGIQEKRKYEISAVPCGFRHSRYFM